MKVRKEKKIISPISCIREKFRLQKVGVVEVFLYKKVVSIFHFEQFSTLLIEYLASLTELSRQRGRCWILIFPFFHTLWVLVSCPPFIFGVTLKKSQIIFQPAVTEAWKLKKAIFRHKMAIVRSDLLIAVYTYMTRKSPLCRHHTELKLRIWVGNYIVNIRPVLKLLWSLDVRNMDLQLLKISNLVSG